jgi:hypothetical protein
MTLISWKNVPDIVTQTLPHALAAKNAYLEQAKERFQFPGEIVTWQPGSDRIRIYSIETNTPLKFDKYAFEFVPMSRQPDLTAEILIKRAALPVVGPVFDFAHKALGGPRPLSNAIVAGLLAGGLGYGAGTLMEQLFPERYLRRGKIRRTLGLTGVGAGALLGLNNAYANAEHTGQSFVDGLLTRNDSMPDYPEPPDVIKKAFMTNSGLDNAMYQPSISVPQFNNAAWRDVNMGFQRGTPFSTPPAYAAATTGLMSGLSTGMNSPIIRPVDVVRGIASAGVGLATATVAGKALSALAGLTPAGQQKLQDMGMWGGMMRAIVPSMFGMR